MTMHLATATSLPLSRPSRNSVICPVAQTSGVAGSEREPWEDRVGGHAEGGLGTERVFTATYKERLYESAVTSHRLSLMIFTPPQPVHSDVPWQSWP